MSLDLKSLEVFVRAAKLGALGKAGAEFGLSPTATTQRIQALEKTVGAQLLHRSTRSISLSADGEIFLLHAEKILAGVEDAFADVQFDPLAIRGELRVASSASFGRKHIAPYIPEFMEKHPGISIQLHLTDAVVDIIEQGFDVAIRLGALAPSALKSRKIGRSPRVIVATPRYLKDHGTPLHPADLQAHDFVLRGDTKSLQFVGPDGMALETRISGRFSTNHAEAVTEVVLSGIGIARKCRWEISEYLESGELVELLDDYIVVPEWDVFAVRPPSPMRPPRVRAFTDFLDTKFKDVPALES